MEFFEFFFSGAEWGWRVFGLIWLIYTIGYVINNLADTYLTYRLGAKAIKEGYSMGVEDDDKSAPATKDDVR